MDTTFQGTFLKSPYFNLLKRLSNESGLFIVS